jgi:hypothetical protein
LTGNSASSIWKHLFQFNLDFIITVFFIMENKNYNLLIDYSCVACKAIKYNIPLDYNMKWNSWKQYHNRSPVLLVYLAYVFITHFFLNRYKWYIGIITQIVKVTYWRILKLFYILFFWLVPSQASDFYSGGTWFECRLGCRLSDRGILWFSSVLPSKCQGSARNYTMIISYHFLSNSSVSNIVSFEAM